MNFLKGCGKFSLRKFADFTSRSGIITHSTHYMSDKFMSSFDKKKKVLVQNCWFSIFSNLRMLELSSVLVVVSPHQFSTSFVFCSKIENSGESSDDESENEEYEDLVRQTFKTDELDHQVFVIQPYIKWGSLKKTITTPELQLNEAVTLIKTLPNWKVVASKLIPLLNFDKPTIFGRGNLEYLSDLITANKTITAVFVSINMLKPEQQRILEELFKVSVFDRYSIVVQIFKIHATTKEAKLQVALGQIPYLWSRLRHDHEGISDKMGGGATVGGPGETYLEIKKRVLQDKERKIKNEIKKLKTQRELLRSKRKILQLPTIAVVGYTNSGKTSLIKALTKEEKLEPKNVLFATLDVTVHAGILQSGLKVLFVDTVGFLSDIPTTLIEAFIATLEDAVQADLLIHIQDVSHPDLKAQTQQVIQTLRSIKLPENVLENMITVANKIDLVKELPADLGNAVPVSSTLGTNMTSLKQKIEDSIIKSTGQIFIKIRVPNGGDEFRWLHKEATVVKVIADEENNQFAFLNTLITEVNLNKFKHKFIKSKVKKAKGKG